MPITNGSLCSNSFFFGYIFLHELFFRYIFLLILYYRPIILLYTPAIYRPIILYNNALMYEVPEISSKNGICFLYAISYANYTASNRYRILLVPIPNIRVILIMSVAKSHLVFFLNLLSFNYVALI
jgi:hypothetical protein